MLNFPIAEVVRATPRAHIVRLALEGKPFLYRAGQAAHLQPEGSPERRTFSFASAPEETARHGMLEFLIQKDPGTPGRFWDLIKPGVLVTVDGPLGSFTLPELSTERRFVFIAGGTGIAPLRSMLWHVVLSESANRMSLIYSARMREDLAYREQFEQLRSEGRIDFRHTATRDGSEVLTGKFGRIDANGLKDFIEPGQTLCFVCGPPPLMNDIRPQLKRFGVRDDQIRMEQW
jgi:NAD(P)H-flavin reductase